MKTISFHSFLVANLSLVVLLWGSTAEACSCLFATFEDQVTGISTAQGSVDAMYVVGGEINVVNGAFAGFKDPSEISDTTTTTTEDGQTIISFNFEPKHFLAFNWKKFTGCADSNVNGFEIISTNPGTGADCGFPPSEGWWVLFSFPDADGFKHVSSCSSHVRWEDLDYARYQILENAPEPVCTP